MLTEIILNSLKPDTSHAPGLSCSGLFPCPYRMYLTHTSQMKWDWDPVSHLNMADGWDQEEQAVRRLKAAGVEVISRGQGERNVRIGRTGIPGSLDGIVVLNGVRYLWEHKALNNSSSWLFRTKGIDAFPGYKAQIHGYMTGKNLDKCIFQIKQKENNEPFDSIIDYDLKFATKVINWADDVRDGWIPEPENILECSYCGVNCFGITIDFGGIKQVDEPDMLEKYRQGKKLQLVGAMMEEEAREYFVGKTDKKTGERVSKGLIGDEDTLLVDDLKISKITQNRSKVDTNLLLQEFGPEALAKVLIQTRGEYYRFFDMRKET